VYTARVPRRQDHNTETNILRKCDEKQWFGEDHDAWDWGGGASKR